MASKKQPLVNAGKIIERFGGIRPMAAKIDTPVTTVQGWKKRDVIPGNRRAQILSAAEAHNIDIADIAEGGLSTQTEAAQKSVSPASKPKKKKTEPQESNVISASVPSVSASNYNDNEKGSGQKIQIEEVAVKSDHENIVSQIEKNNRRAVATSTWIATGLILLAGAVGLYLFWPYLKKNQDTLEAQSQQLVNLEDKVEEVEIESKKKFLGTSLPDNLQEKIDGLQNQARNISVTVDQLSKRAKEISTETLGDTAQAISERLAILETKLEELSGPEGSFASLIARIRGLEETVTGQTQLEHSADQLRSIVKDEDNDIDENLADVQDQDEGALGETLVGVSGQDLKAAAILIAFSQFRTSLEREAPFEEDLALLQNLIGDDNPVLQKKLSRLSRHADGGVLTPAGLSSELKKMTGDIVVSSLIGEDVSIKEKAKARFGDIVRIEKDGEMVSGTQTQATVAKAQEYIDEGKIEDSITTLESLDGEAAMAAQPFIDQAQTTLLAEQIKTMLNEVILSKVDGSVDSLQNVEVPDVDIDQMKQNIQKVVPFLGNGEIVKDEESGVTILPKKSGGFRGFSDTQ